MEIESAVGKGSTSNGSCAVIEVNTEPRRTLIRVNTPARTANSILSDRSSESIIEGGKELTDPDAPLAAEPMHLEEKLEKLQNEMKVLSVKHEGLQNQIESLKFGFHRFIGSDDDMNYYTGISPHHFLALSAFLNAGDICSRLRVNIPEKVLADNYKISVVEVSRIFVTWLDLIYSRLVQLPAWASKNTIQTTMPECFREKYPLTRVIIDCTEIFIEKPSCFRAQSGTYSSYESHNTAKGLIGIGPHGAVTFVSELYGGHCSDKAIVEDCGILHLLEEGDSVMADRGFEIQDLLAKKKVYLNIPPFMRCKEQLSPKEEDETRDVA
ncbi:uncharacterized protein [Montipora foliosa]|uniref:uncharacterized protein n=1 Tax=Montipora foliosa TaxID=591990 RepID=UPI0035F183F8